MTFIAGLLITLHGFIPHHHDLGSNDSVVYLSSSEGTDFLGMVKQVFQQDLGENHLENFVVSEFTDQQDPIDYQIIPLGYLPVASSLINSPLLLGQEPSFLYSGPQIKRVPSIPSGLRAPPYVA